MATHSICPLKGRVGTGYGVICDDQAPAQFTTMADWKVVFAVVTPITWPWETVTDMAASPEEMSTPRCLHAFRAATERARGSTLRSGIQHAAKSPGVRRGSISDNSVGLKALLEGMGWPVWEPSRIVPWFRRSTCMPDSSWSS